MADLRERLQEALVGRYQLERELGRGGMATVYLAHDLKHDRLVALKVLHLDLAATLGPERFQQEIRTTARLQHPHILPVLDSGEATGQLWYTMPYVEGEALRDRLRREWQLPLDDALRITREVADALSYAHDHGLVHRDIKPENILLGRGHALVADFGIARALQVTDAEPLTATGVAVGTPAYMSPEQAGGTPNVDGRSDLYSLGCVLYEMLAGEVPYTGRTPQAVIAKRILEPLPHVRTLRASVPEAVEQAISRALAVSPADRFATAAEFTRALAQPINRSGTTNSSVAPQSMEVYGRRHTARRLALLALGVLLAVGVLLAWLRTRSEPLKVGPRRLAVLPFENLGRPEDEYFADGVTDEVRGKLAALPGLEVIARASSREYKQSSKRPQQIGRELGVDYLLTGTVRWEKNTDGSSRVRVSPELIHASTASAKWQTPFEASLTDVFQVQGRIAADVAQALGVILGATDREVLAAPPTRNMAAYDAFLRGMAAKSAAEFDIPALHRAQEEFDETVRLDSTFARAWAELSVVLATLYSLDVSSMSATQDRAARKAAERALALAPDQPYGYWALGTYFGMVQLDNARALKEFARGQRIAPQDAGLLAGLGASEFFIGRLEQALVHQRQAEVLDPRSTSIAAGVATVLLALRRYGEAMTTVNRPLALEPDNLLLIHTKMQVYLADADLAGHAESCRLLRLTSTQGRSWCTRRSAATSPGCWTAPNNGSC